MKVLLKADGRTESDGMDLIVHNERLADGLDAVTRLLDSVKSKRKKTEADIHELSRIEWYGGLYMSGSSTAGNAITVDEAGELYCPSGSVPVIPSWNILRVLQEGAKRHKRGPDVLRGVHPVGHAAPIIYDGPTDPDLMWKDDGRFSLRKGVGVMRNKVMRTRPIFREWQLECEFEIDPVVLDLDTVQTFWRDAGRYVGIGEMRPVFGRFTGTVEEIKATAKKAGKK
jgi:hypothetical protein